MELNMMGRKIVIYRPTYLTLKMEYEKVTIKLSSLC